MSAVEEFEDGMIEGGFAFMEGKPVNDYGFIGSTYARGWVAGWYKRQAQQEGKELRRNANGTYTIPAKDGKRERTFSTFEDAKANML